MMPAVVPLAPPLALWGIGPFRLCEAVLLVGLVLAPLIGQSLGPIRFGIVLAALILLHVAAEGWRWQMVPLYLAIPILLLWLIGPPWPRAISWLGGMIGPAAGVTAFGLAFALPIFHLPPPEGRFVVGTRVYRPNTTNGPTIQIWYPATPGGTGTAAYRGEPGPALLSYQGLVPTEASAEAPPLASAAPFRPILLIHGLGGTRLQNTALALDLASEGYLVAAYDRPGGADPGVALDLSDDAARKKTLDQGAKAVAAGAVDASTVLTALDHLGGPFEGRVATDRAVLIGFSFGGAVAAEACRHDTRFAAALNMDGWLFGGAREQGVPCLYMLVNDGEPVPPASDLAAPDPATRAAARMQIDDAAAQERSFRQHGGWDLTIAGSAHTDFTDAVFYSPLRRLTHAGDRPPGRVQTVIRLYATALAERAFTGRTAEALETPPTGFPEVQFRHWLPALAP
jgi:dienelactone hydrolase